MADGGGAVSRANSLALMACAVTAAGLVLASIPDATEPEVVGAALLVVVAPVTFAAAFASIIAVPLGPIETEVRGSADADSTGALERAALMLGWTLAVLAVGAVVLHALGATFDAESLRWWLAGVDVVGCGALWHAGRTTRPVPPLLPRMLTAGLAAAVLVGGAIAGAIAITQPPRPARGVESYSVLAARMVGPSSLEVQVRSLEAAQKTYRLVVRDGARRPRQVTLKLRPGQRWQSSFALGGVGTKVRVALYAPRDSGAPYRTLELTS
jgi:hypothetical protein